MVASRCAWCPWRAQHPESAPAPRPSPQSDLCPAAPGQARSRRHRRACRTGYRFGCFRPTVALRRSVRGRRAGPARHGERRGEICEPARLRFRLRPASTGRSPRLRGRCAGPLQGADAAQPPNQQLQFHVTFERRLTAAGQLRADIEEVLRRDLSLDGSDLAAGQATALRSALLARYELALNAGAASSGHVETTRLGTDALLDATASEDAVQRVARTSAGMRWRRVPRAGTRSPVGERCRGAWRVSFRPSPPRRSWRSLLAGSSSGPRRTPATEATGWLFRAPRGGSWIWRPGAEPRWPRDDRRASPPDRSRDGPRARRRRCGRRTVPLDRGRAPGAAGIDPGLRARDRREPADRGRSGEVRRFLDGALESLRALSSPGRHPPGRAMGRSAGRIRARRRACTSGPGSSGRPDGVGPGGSRSGHPAASDPRHRGGFDGVRHLRRPRPGRPLPAGARTGRPSTSGPTSIFVPSTSALPWAVMAAWPPRLPHLRYQPQRPEARGGGPRFEPLLGDRSNLLVGAGLRVSRSLRVSAGALLFLKNDHNPLVTDRSLAATLYAGVSFDVDVVRALRSMGQ